MADAAVGVREQIALQARRDVVRREDDGCVEIFGMLRGLLDLVEREVFDRSHLHAMRGVAKLGVEEIVRDRPRCEHCRVRVVLVDEGDGFLVHDDHVAVDECVLRREGGGRVDPEAANERWLRWPPSATASQRRAFAPGVDAEQKDDRVDRQQIAREQRSAQDGEGNPVGDDEQSAGEAR